MGVFAYSLMGSDMAADMVAGIVKSINKDLLNGLKEEGNEYNTSGPENVGMFFHEIINKHDLLRNDNTFEGVACRTLEKLLKIKDEMKDPEMGASDKYKVHINRCIAAVKKYLSEHGKIMVVEGKVALI